MKITSARRARVAFVAGCLAFSSSVAFAQSWEPTKTVEFVVPAGTGGGADQMARVVQGIVAKHNLMKQSMVVVNKAGGAGSEGFLDVKAAKGDPHKIIITLSNLFTTPLAQDTPFNWRDLTPVQMLASQGDMAIFFSNVLVGSLTGLALFLLFWPLMSLLIARLRGR